MGVAPKWVAIPFWSDSLFVSIDFNGTSAASAITALTLSVNGPLRTRQPCIERYEVTPAKAPCPYPSWGGGRVTWLLDLIQGRGDQGHLARVSSPPPGPDLTVPHLPRTGYTSPYHPPSPKTDTCENIRLFLILVLDLGELDQFI